MKKSVIIRKVIAVCTILVTTFIIVLSSGCNPNRFEDSGEQLREDMTVLRVEYFDGGVGGEWLKLAAERFEQKYEGVSLEEGKRGLQVFTNPSPSSNFDLLAKSDYNIFFAESVDYFKYASQGLFLDITDVVKSKPEGEENTIESKLYDAHKTGLTAIDGKYYAIPHYEFFHSAMYDRDLFDDYNFYYADNGGFVTSKTDKKSKGPDGVYGTGDDGMPVTYDEFFNLCDLMVSQGVTPFIWTGEFSGYLLKFLSQIGANYSGFEGWSANLTFNGQTQIITDSSLTETTVTITPETGYQLASQAGKYQALKFLERMLSNPDYYYCDSLLKTYSNTEAQEQFVYSKLDNEPIAMLIEGSFWENEAKADLIFERSIIDKGERAKNRKFGIMSLPLGNGDVSNKKTALMENGMSYAFINANIKNNQLLVDLCKEFLVFCYTDVSLAEFTSSTNMTKAVKYDLSTTQYQNLTAFGKQLWDLRKSSDVIYQISNSRMLLENPKIFDFSTRFKTVVTVNDLKKDYLLPITALRDGVSALDYFLGMAVSEDDWKNAYSSSFQK